MNPGAAEHLGGGAAASTAASVAYSLAMAAAVVNGRLCSEPRRLR
jgi:hypothetical protein